MRENQPPINDLYDRYADGIYTYSLVMLADPVLAATATRDVFAEWETAEPGQDLRDRVGLFSIARQRAKGRSARGAETAGGAPADIRSLIEAASDSLEERDRRLMALNLAVGMEGEELAAVVNADPGEIENLVTRMRDRVEKTIGPFLVARLGCDDCGELAGVVGDWDGQFSVEVRSRLNRHMAGCQPCQQRRRELIAPGGALSTILWAEAPESVRTEVQAPISEPETAAASPERTWVGVATFAVIAVVTGLVGLAVSAGFEPLDLPDLPVAESPQPVATPTTSTTVSSPSTTGVLGPTSTQPVDPPRIEVAGASLDFGDSGTTGSFEIVNTGGANGSWSASPGSDAITLSATEGEVAPGESVTIDVTLDRELVEEGDINETITVAWDGGQAEVSAVGTLEDNPIVHNPKVSPSQVRVDGGSCSPTQATVSARIRDTSSIESAVVRWSPDGGATKESPMLSVGNDMFESVVGPFSVAQTASIRIVAFDKFDNAGGATISLEVLPCP